MFRVGSLFRTYTIGSATKNRRTLSCNSKDDIKHTMPKILFSFNSNIDEINNKYADVHLLRSKYSLIPKNNNKYTNREQYITLFSKVCFTA